MIVPLMQADAVHTYHWMTHSQFLNAVALGQVTSGPVTQTVSAVGYAAHGLAGAVLAAAAVALLVLRRGIVQTLLAAGAVGAAVALLGGPVSS